ncbi:MAG: tyrosine-type recombinase/integrase, partial [Gemmatimonadota bacterium]|nr:tyrosine-type recombinase/integrase [Gemmatimonadota bacterium]
MSMNQVQQLLLSVRRSGQKSGRDFALIYLMLSTGIRRIEASRSNICDLVNRGDRTTLLVQGKGHNSKDDFVIVHPEVLEVLQHYISRRHGPRNYRAPLFLNEGTHSGRLLPYTITRIVRHALDEAGLGGFNLTTHSLRATTA